MVPPPSMAKRSAFGAMPGPARRIRWVGKAGVPLEPAGDDLFRCPSTGALYRETAPDTLTEVES